MLHKTKGIFLQKLDYSETSIIAKIYTKEFGIQTYLLKGIKGKRSKIKANILQHLALLNMEVYHKNQANLQRIKELHIDFAFEDIPYNMRKSTIALFINELLNKCIQEEEANPALFDFLYEAIFLLDQTKESTKSFHLVFIHELSKHLGFQAQISSEASATYFDMMEGHFQPFAAEHVHYMNEEETAALKQVLRVSLPDSHKLNLSRTTQNALLHKMIEYYRLHVPDMKELKSLTILQQIFS